MSRRALLKGGLTAGAGLVIGFHVRPERGRARPSAADAAETAFAPNAWVRIDPDGTVTIVNSQSELGQGTLTTMALIVADELEADWSRVKVVQSGADPVYGNPNFGGQQLTAGSQSIRGLLPTWRRAGAAAREMLMTTAATAWGVPVAEVRAEQGVVHHDRSGRTLTYGELADKAARLPVPQSPRLKRPEEWRLIGKGVPRLDTPDKVTGRAIFGIDVQLPGMLVATVARCPVFGGKAKRFDATGAKAVAGVRHVVKIGSGVAVVADSYWAATRGRDALQIEWDEGAIARVSSDTVRDAYRALAQKPGPVARREGDAERTLGAAAQVIETVYELPFLAHATMEPQNATAHVRPDGCDVWAPTQNQSGSQATAMRLTGFPREAVRVHTTFVGGGFGRRSETDYIADAVEVSKAVAAPVKVIWSREDDIRHDFYRPATYNVLRAALGPDGMPVAWLHRIAGAGIMAQRGWVRSGQADRSAVEGAANMPYDVPNLLVEFHHRDLGIPVGFWRSVGASHNAFVVESFVDELAHTARKDPFEYRRVLLGKSPRHKGVLELAARKAGWGRPLPPGRHRGIAVAFSYGSWAAQVAEVSVADDGRVRVHRVVCALDCGLAVNPDQIRAQMEGGIVYGLTAALYGAITIRDGRVEQSNFHDYPMLRIDEMPAVEVHIVPSVEPPGGVGEPGVPPIAPAVANAVFAATATRIRRLPIRADDLQRT